MTSPTPISSTFHHCPRCGASAEEVGAVPFDCSECSFRFFFNPVAAVGGIIEDSSGQVLLIRRGHDPGKGKLGMPGGFVDVGETAEEALRREISEEVGLQIDSCTYLVTFPNQYQHRGVVAPVLDLFFVCTVESFAGIEIDPAEVEHHHICKPDGEELSSMAFESNRKALEYYLRRKRESEQL